MVRGMRVPKSIIVLNELAELDLLAETGTWWLALHVRYHRRPSALHEADISLENCSAILAKLNRRGVVDRSDERPARWRINTAGRSELNSIIMPKPLSKKIYGQLVGSGTDNHGEYIVVKLGEQP